MKLFCVCMNRGVARRDTATARRDAKYFNKITITFCYLSHSVLLTSTPTPTLNLPHYNNTNTVNIVDELAKKLCGVSLLKSSEVESPLKSGPLRTPSDPIGSNYF